MIFVVHIIEHLMHLIICTEYKQQQKIVVRGSCIGFWEDGHKSLSGITCCTYFSHCYKYLSLQNK